MGTAARRTRAPERSVAASAGRAAARGRPADSRALRAAIERPEAAGVDAILDLQRMSGNRAVRALLAASGIQASLQVGPADDAYEQEADRIAGAALGGSVPDPQRPTSIASAISPVAQRHTPDRKPADAEEDPDELEEAKVRRKAVDGGDAGFAATAHVESTLAERAGLGRPLDGPVRAEMQARFGADFHGVRIHDDPVAVQLNRAVGAHAFTHGRDIYFGAGRFAPTSSDGRQLLAHELTHVVQQSGGGRSRPVQRANIPRGAALPDLKVTTGKRIADKLNSDAELQLDATRSAFRKLLGAIKTNASLRQALGTMGATLKDDVLEDVRAAYVGPLTTAVAELKKLAPTVRAGRDANDATALLINVENDVDTELRAKAKGPDLVARKRIVVALRDVMGDRLAGALSHFEETRGDVAMGPAYLADADRAAFAAALKQLGVVQGILGQPRPAASQAGGGGSQPAEWRDKGKLRDKVVVKRSKGIPKWLSKRREGKPQDRFKARIDQVDAWLRAVLEPEIMARVTKPTIMMHTRGQMKVVGSAQRFFFLPDPTGFRPNYGSGIVNLSFDESFELIAHEMGHAIEEFLPLRSWHDMNVLLERRHGEKVGTSRAARTGATFWTSGLPLSVENEGRYAGSYETGKYTSTAYDDAGNAEVFSQAIEFFSNTANALKLIDGDPQHAAIVLRSIAPREYAGNTALRAFDKFLPGARGGGGT